MKTSPLITLLFLITIIGHVLCSSTPKSIKDLQLEKLRYPLDSATLKLVTNAGLVTSQPDIDQNSPFVVTPFGVFGRECYFSSPSNSRISETHNGDLLIEYENGTSSIYRASKFHCRERFAPENLPSNQHKNKRFVTSIGKEFKKGSTPRFGDGWLDNAFFNASVEIGFFQSNYSVPQTPSQTSNQILYWFIGTTSAFTSTEAILQPVLTYSSGGWGFTSWYCCPSGTPNKANTITGFGPGDILQGYINATSSSGSSFYVLSCYGNQCSKLACPAGPRVFTLADITLETYYVTSCSQMATGPMTFSYYQMSDLRGQRLKPQWGSITGPTECSGSIKFVGDNTAIITHENHLINHSSK